MIAAMTITVQAVGLSTKVVVEFVVDVDWLVLVVGAVAGLLWVCCVVVEFDEYGAVVAVSVATM